MSEIRPQEIASFWKFSVVDVPIDKLSLYVKRNMSLKGEKKEWETIDDPIVIEMLRFPISEEDLLNVLGPGEYTIALRYRKDDGGPLLCYGKEVYIKVGIKEEVAETAPKVVAPIASPEMEMLRANLDKQRETLAGQKAFIDTIMQTLDKLIDQQKSSESQFKDQLLMRVIDKMGSNQVDVGGIYAKALDTRALFASKRLDVMAASKKGEAELQCQESKQKHEINLIKLQQQLKAGQAGRAEVKNDGSPEDDAKKANVVQDIVDAITKIGPVIDNFGEFVEKVKPTILSIKDIANIVQGKPLVDDTIDEGAEEEEPLAEEEQPAEEPAPVKPRIISIGRAARIKEPEPPEDDSTATASKDEPYDPNDPRKQ